MSIIKSNYSSGKVTLLRQLLENNAQAGTPTDYEIRVDGMKVIPRTNNHELFDNHEDFVNQETAEITIILYEGNSRRSTRHVLSLKEEPKKETVPPPAPGLSGVEVEKMMEDKLRAQRQEIEFGLLRKEVKELKERAEDSEQYADELEGVVEKAKANGNKIGGLHWGEIAGVAFEGILRRNAHLLLKIPGAEGLAGLLTGDSGAKLEEGKQQPVTETFFKEKEGPEAAEENDSFKKANQEERDMEGFIGTLQTHFKTEEKVKMVFNLLNTLVAKPQAIEPAIIFVHGWKGEQKPHPKQETGKPSPESKHEKAEVNSRASLPKQEPEIQETRKEETEQEDRETEMEENREY
jgi:hypothetical protein